MSAYIANFEHILQPIVFISWVYIKLLFLIFSFNNYQFKVTNQNTRTMLECEIWTSEHRYIAIKTPGGSANAGRVATS